MFESRNKNTDNTLEDAMKDSSSRKSQVRVTGHTGDSGDEIDGEYESDDSYDAEEFKQQTTPVKEKVTHEKLQQLAEGMSCLADVRVHDLEHQGVTSQHISSMDINKVLLIVTGGTLCMV